MSAEVEAVPRAKLPVFETIAEGVSSLSSMSTVLTIQILLIAVAGIFLDVVPALILGMPSDLVIGMHVLAVPKLISTAVGVAQALVLLFLHLNLMFGVACGVLRAEQPTVLSLIQWRGRPWLGVISVIAFLFLAESVKDIAQTMPSLGASTSEWADFATGGSWHSPFGVLVLLWLTGWMITEIPVLTMRGHFLKAWKISEGNRLRLMMNPLGLILLVLAPLFTLGWLYSISIDGWPVTLGDRVMIENIAIALACACYAAIGSAVYRRLDALSPTSTTAKAHADSSEIPLA
jgi:hypothetical protein